MTKPKRDSVGEYSVNNPFDSADIKVTAKAKARVKTKQCEDCKKRSKFTMKLVGFPFRLCEKCFNKHFTVVTK